MSAFITCIHPVGELLGGGGHPLAPPSQVSPATSFLEVMAELKARARLTAAENARLHLAGLATHPPEGANQTRNFRTISLWL